MFHVAPFKQDYSLTKIYMYITFNLVTLSTFHVKHT